MSSKSGSRASGKAKTGSGGDPFKERARKALADVASKAERDRHVVQHIVAGLQKRGAKTTAQQVRMWLGIDAGGKTLVPSLGAGLLVIEIAATFRPERRKG